MNHSPKSVFPVALVLEGRACLVVGSGPALTRRPRALLDVQAKPSVVSNAPSSEIRALAQSGDITLHERDFSDTDLNDQWLAVLVDEDPTLAARMSRIAAAQRVFFCAVDQPEHNSYSHMA